jgi:hypothetical protein
MVISLDRLVIADQAGRAGIRTMQKVSGRCAVNLVAAHTIAHTAAMEREAGGVEAEDYRSCNDAGLSGIFGSRSS